MGFWKNVEIERDNEVSALTAFAVSKALNVSIEKLLEIPTQKTNDDLQTTTESYLFKKYSLLINTLESLSPEKRKLVLNINKTLLTDLNKI